MYDYSLFFSVLVLWFLAGIVELKASETAGNRAQIAFFFLAGVSLPFLAIVTGLTCIFLK